MLKSIPKRGLFVLCLIALIIVLPSKKYLYATSNSEFDSLEEDMYKDRLEAIKNYSIIDYMYGNITRINNLNTNYSKKRTRENKKEESIMNCQDLAMVVKLGTNSIRVNKIIIKSSMELFVTVNNEGKIGRFEGIKEKGTKKDPVLDITSDSILTITTDIYSPNMIFGKEYTVISGFNMTDEVRSKIICGEGLRGYFDDKGNYLISLSKSNFISERLHAIYKYISCK